MKTALFAVAAATALAVSAPSSAQEAADDPIAACRAAHANDAQARINCLETAIARMQGRVVEAQQQAAEAQQQAAAAQQAQQAQSDRPGWSLPGFRAAQNEEPEEVRAQLVRIRYTGDGHGLFTTADGKVWRETEASPAHRRLDPQRTYEVTLSRGNFGGFRMTIDGVRYMYRVEPIN